MKMFAVFDKDNVQVSSEACRNEYRAWLCFIEDKHHETFLKKSSAECDKLIAELKEQGYIVNTVVVLREEVYNDMKDWALSGKYKTSPYLWDEFLKAGE